MANWGYNTNTKHLTHKHHCHQLVGTDVSPSFNIIITTIITIIITILIISIIITIYIIIIIIIWLETDGNTAKVVKLVAPLVALGQIVASDITRVFDRALFLFVFLISLYLRLYLFFVFCLYF